MTCCGQPMQRDGSQLVCRKCGAWIDPGTTKTASAPLTAALHALADRLDQQPNRPADIFNIRGHARTHGLTGDWLDLLPTPDGAHHSTYAARLRTLAGGH